MPLQPEVPPVIHHALLQTHNYYFSLVLDRVLKVIQWSLVGLEPYLPGTTARPREIIAAANANGVPVMGIRAAQAGALTDAIDRPLPDDHGERRDYDRAAPFRAVAAEIGAPAARLAHQYALSMPGVATVVLGVKNRAELRDCLAAEADGPLDPALAARIDAAVGRR